MEAVTLAVRQDQSEKCLIVNGRASSLLRCEGIACLRRSGECVYRNGHYWRASPASRSAHLRLRKPISTLRGSDGFWDRRRLDATTYRSGIIYARRDMKRLVSSHIATCFSPAEQCCVDRAHIDYCSCDQATIGRTVGSLVTTSGRGLAFPAPAPPSPPSVRNLRGSYTGREKATRQSTVPGTQLTRRITKA